MFYLKNKFDLRAIISLKVKDSALTQLRGDVDPNTTCRHGTILMISISIDVLRETGEILKNAWNLARGHIIETKLLDRRARHVFIRVYKRIVSSVIVIKSRSKSLIQP